MYSFCRSVGKEDVLESSVIIVLDFVIFKLCLNIFQGFLFLELIGFVFDKNKIEGFGRVVRNYVNL